MSGRHIIALKIAVFLLALLPISLLLLRAYNNQLGANPIETITDSTGIWTLRMLAITLAISPLRMLTGATVLLRFRRMLGLFSFFYASLHFLTYIWLDQYFDWPFIVEDIIEHPYVIVGFCAFLILLSLAISSQKQMVRKLGKNWKKLHRLVYPAAFLACLHFIWLVKSDLREPLLYFGIFILLMLLRLPVVQKKILLLSSKARTA
mgnify:CR=1 FL=1